MSATPRWLADYHGCGVPFDGARRLRQSHMRVISPNGVTSKRISMPANCRFGIRRQVADERPVRMIVAARIERVNLQCSHVMQQFLRRRAPCPPPDRERSSSSASVFRL